MKKKLLSLMLVAAMTATMVAGCGGSDSDSGDAGTAGTGAEATGTEAGGAASGDNKLTVWCWDPAFNIYSMEEAGKVYQETHPDFELEVVEVPWADIQTKLTTAATAGDLSRITHSRRMLSVIQTLS